MGAGDVSFYYRLVLVVLCRTIASTKGYFLLFLLVIIPNCQRNASPNFETRRRARREKR